MDPIEVMPPELVTMVESVARGDAALQSRVLHTLGALTQGVRHSAWPEAAWHFSYLTHDGYPVEFTFTSGDDADDDRVVRYTCEIAGPEDDTRLRLGQAQRLLSDLGAEAVPSRLAQQLCALQAGQPLRYGAWVGARHRAGDVRVRFKLYAEVPRPPSALAAAFVAEWLGAEPILQMKPPELSMVGVDLANARVELYFRVRGMTTTDVAVVLGRFGLMGRAAEVLALLDEANGRPLREYLPGSQQGVSVSLPLKGEGPVVVSVFCGARLLLGGMRGVGWAMGEYERCGAGTGGRGVVSVVVSCGGVGVHVGVRATNDMRVSEISCKWLRIGEP